MKKIVFCIALIVPMALFAQKNKDRCYADLCYNQGKYIVSEQTRNGVSQVILTNSKGTTIIMTKGKLGEYTELSQVVSEFKRAYTSSLEENVQVYFEPEESATIAEHPAKVIPFDISVAEGKKMRTTKGKLAIMIHKDYVVSISYQGYLKQEKADMEFEDFLSKFFFSL